MGNTEQTDTQVWCFTEDNDWEGECWKVWFEAPAELESKLSELRGFLYRHNSDNYSLKQMDDFPDSYGDNELDQCEYAETAEDDEDCGDCDYCSGSEGYFPAESKDELNVDILNTALEHYRSEGWRSEQDDPLYKLGLFQ